MLHNRISLSSLIVRPAIETFHGGSDFKVRVTAFCRSVISKVNAISSGSSNFKVTRFGVLKRSRGSNRKTMKVSECLKWIPLDLLT